MKFFLIIFLGITIEILIISCRNSEQITMFSATEKTTVNVTLKYKGNIRVTQKNTPWEKEIATFQDQHSNFHKTELPIEDPIMKLILDNSNYTPSKDMARQVANIFFQTIVTPCPDDWSFTKRIEGNNVTIEYRVVDRNGILWELKIRSNDNNKDFHSKRTNVFYKNLVRF